MREHAQRIVLILLSLACGHLAVPPDRAAADRDVGPADQPRHGRGSRESLADLDRRDPQRGRRDRLLRRHLMLLSEMGIPTAHLMSWLAVVGLAVAFGAQSLIKDFFSGFMILLEQQYMVNDVVKIDDVTGQVERITLRMTVLRDLGGHVHFIPHGAINRVSNSTQGWSRAVFNIGVAYGEDIDHVMNVLIDLARQMRDEPEYSSLIMEDMEMLGVDELAESAVVIRSSSRPGRSSNGSSDASCCGGSKTSSTSWESRFPIPPARCCTAGRPSEIWPGPAEADAQKRLRTESGLTSLPHKPEAPAKGQWTRNGRWYHPCFLGYVFPSRPAALHPLEQQFQIASPLAGRQFQPAGQAGQRGRPASSVSSSAENSSSTKCPKPPTSSSATSTACPCQASCNVAGACGPRPPEQNRGPRAARRNARRFRGTSPSGSSISARVFVWRSIFGPL